jgi:phosphatidylglycerophosphatase A
MPKLRRYSILFVATGFGVGYLPVCPGTFGTLAAVPLSLLLNHIALTNPWLAALGLAALAVGAAWLADQSAQLVGSKDPQLIVIDEIAGFALANFLTVNWVGLILAFGFFRFFDIAKVFPAKKLEALPGGAGIVMDDLVAGLYTFVILRLVSLAGSG